MIGKLEIEGIHMEVDKDVRDYATLKIGHLDKYLPKHAKLSAHAEVVLKNVQDKKNRSACEVNLYLPKEVINVQASGVTIYAAIDIVEAKLQHRIQKYKDLHESSRLKRHLVGKFRKKAAQNTRNRYNI